MGKFERLQAKAKSHLSTNEKIHSVIMGAYETEILGNDSVRNGIFIATDKRLLFYAKKLTGYELEDFPYSNISSIESGKNMMGHHISFFASGNKVKMKWITKGDVEKFISHVRSNIGKQSQDIPEQKTHQHQGKIGIPEQIEKLSKLKEQGILTEEEFQNKKDELLSRM